MDVPETFLIAHAGFRQEVAMHVYGMVILNRESQHAVVTHVERMLHDNR